MNRENLCKRRGFAEESYQGTALLAAAGIPINGALFGKLSRPYGRKGGESMKKKLMAIILSVLFIVALFPVSAFATGESVLFLGDSITTGYGLGGGEKSYVDIMESDGYDIAVDAESGFTTQDILNNMEEYEFAIGATDFVVITIGGNDLMNTLYKFVVDKYNADPDNGGKH